MRSSYLDYAMSVIVGRALPDVRDGLKPVHRRVLYAMHDLGLQPNRPYRKCAFIVGEVMGKVPPARRLGDLRHAGPHGAGVLPALPAGRRPGQLRLDRRRPGGRDALHGGPARPAGDARCCATSTRTPSTSAPTTTSRPQEPLLLPARFPNLLVNGAAGIAVGMATNIPPHNLREVTGAVNAYIDDPEVDLNGLMKHVKGPDFPAAGSSWAARASATPTPPAAARSGCAPGPTSSRLKGGKEAIIVTELPFMVKKGGEGGLITKIADLVRDKKITGISDLRDESDRSGMRIVIELKRGGRPGQGRAQPALQAHRRCSRASASTWWRWSTACRGRSACSS